MWCLLQIKKIKFIKILDSKMFNFFNGLPGLGIVVSGNVSSIGLFADMFALSAFLKGVIGSEILKINCHH